MLASIQTIKTYFYSIGLTYMRIDDKITKPSLDIYNYAHTLDRIRIFLPRQLKEKQTKLWSDLMNKYLSIGA